MACSPEHPVGGANTPVGFAELHCLSNFSFLRGASHPEELIQQAMIEGYAGLAVTDECSVAGVVKAWAELRQYQSTIHTGQTGHAGQCAGKTFADSFKFIPGAEFNYEGECFVVLADSRQAYGQLCRLISQCQQRAEKGRYQFSPIDLLQLQQGLLLWRPLLSSVAVSASAVMPVSATAAGVGSLSPPGWLDDILAHFQQRFWLLLELGLNHKDRLHHHHVYELAQQYQLPVLASSYAQMHRSERKMLHDTLTAIRLNRPITEIKKQLLPNGENHLRSLPKLQAIYPPACLAETLKVIERCHFSLDEIRYQYPEESVPKGYSAPSYLREQTYAGARKRYPRGIPEKVEALIDKELRIIGELNYEYYFLTIFDIVSFARAQHILCQGRGSAANSVVCYCLHITEVDPTRTSVLFERFISKRRNEPPDIDVDFENARREEVIQYIYQRYGRDRCAIAATVITYRPKSALRDLGKALDIDLLQLENVIANYGWRYRGKDWIDEVISPQLSRNSHTLSCLRVLLSQLLGFPRHLSQHVGGFVISQGPLLEIVPVENAAMAERTVIQWDKNDLEALGLMKVDILALGMLTAIRKTLDYIGQYEDTTSKNGGKTVSLADIPKTDDPRVYGMLQQADSVGLFQVESRAQMNMLPRLKPEKYYDLVVQVAIVRPGPIHGDMVHPYLKRKNGEEAPDVPLKELEPILARTFGVPIFQEQVIAMAMVGAGFNGDEAEELRRSMASWKKQGHMGSLRHKMSLSLLAKGMTKEYVERICRQIEGFGEYGFPESHAASFALLAYISAWLKYYYPAAFCCGLLNSQPMGFYQPWQLIQDAQRHGVIVLPVDVNKSVWDYTLETGAHLESADKSYRPVSAQSEQTGRIDTKWYLRCGFCSVKGLSQAAADALVKHRPNSGFQSIAEVMQRSHLPRNELESLASANAFASLDKHRYQQRWEVSAHGFYQALFEQEVPQSQVLKCPSRLETIVDDLSNTGVILNDHPVAYLRDQAALDDCVQATSLSTIQPEQEVFVAGVVVNRQRPGTSAGVTFVTLEDETGSINVVIWLQTALKQMETLVKARLLKVYGKVEKDAGGAVIHLIAYKLFDISKELERLEAKSRDYH